jgi:ABC-2 type transport system permease protein
MIKFWRVAFYEYTRHVLRRRFLFALLSVPSLIAAMGLVGFLIVSLQTKDTPVGYVDPSGFLANPIPASKASPANKPIPLIPFGSEAQAKQALESKQIQAYYVLPADYPKSVQVKLVYLEQPSSSAEGAFRDFLRVNLLAGQPPAILERIDQGTQLTVRSADGSRQMSEKNWFNIFTPFAAGLAFIIAIFTSSGYLMQAVVEEKENRTMEILITSVSPLQMMSGKIIGIIAVGLTQLLVWISVGVIGVLIGRNTIDWLKAIHLAPGSLALMAIVMIPGFVLIAALMATVGATVTEEREGQQVTGLFTLPVVIPYWFTYQIMSNPNGPLAVGLSYFPLTAPVTLTMRAGFTFVPAWQVALNVGILVLAALGALWLAGRAFRLGMLRYGQRVTWREIFGRPVQEGANRE